jgi:MSHA biogenesis protein MshM
MWERHWRLGRDPFVGPDALYVATPTHAEAVARLVYAITSGQRSACLHAPAGLGKTTVISQAIIEARRRLHRIALVRCPTNGPMLLADLAERLGLRVPAGASRAHAWRRLADAVRLVLAQRQPVVLAVDNCHYLTDHADRLDLARLVHLAPCPEAQLTVIQVGRVAESVSVNQVNWELAIRLAPLTRSEAEAYLTAKLAAAGRDEPVFTPAALTRLHALSDGVPRGLDRLASLCLMAGAWQGLDLIAPQHVEAAALECLAQGHDNTWLLPAYPRRTG